MQHVVLQRGTRLYCPLRLCHQTRISNCHVLAGRRAFQVQPFPIEAQPTTTSDDGSRTLRVRKDGNRNLPLSPVMDPVAVEARERHKKPKSPPSKKEETLSAFSRELEKNEFARALATPVRRCNVTRARLPSHFLLPFVAKIPPAEELRPVPGEAQNAQSKSTLKPAVLFKPQVPASYALATEHVVEELERGKWTTLVTERLKRRLALRLRKSAERTRTGKEWTFHYAGRLSNIVHEELSAVVVRSLRWCFEYEDETLVASLPTGSNKCPDDVACIIRLPSADLVQVSNASLFDAEKLLTEEQQRLLQDMVEQKTASETAALALLRHPQTIVTLLSLEKLKNYLSTRATKTT